MVMAVYAPDSKKSLEMYEECVSSVVKVLCEGRKDGARDSCITGDFNVELGLMCADENDNEERTKMYGPLCWQGHDKDPGGFLKIMWYGIMKEFYCKVSSTRSVCGKVRAETFRHRHFRPRQERRNFAAGSHDRAHEKKRRKPHPQRRKTVGPIFARIHDLSEKN